jgi:hypothetical protein
MVPLPKNLFFRIILALAPLIPVELTLRRVSVSYGRGQEAEGISLLELNFCDLGCPNQHILCHRMSCYYLGCDYISIYPDEEKAFIEQIILENN